MARDVVVSGGGGFLGGVGACCILYHFIRSGALWPLCSLCNLWSDLEDLVFYYVSLWVCVSPCFSRQVRWQMHNETQQKARQEPTSIRFDANFSVFEAWGTELFAGNYFFVVQFFQGHIGHVQGPLRRAPVQPRRVPWQPRRADLQGLGNFLWQ